MTILDEIVLAKSTELSLEKEQTSLATLEAKIASQSRPLNLSGALLGDSVRLIAEIKKASPSRGLLCANFDPVSLANTYALNGAAAISVLTDPRFQGDLEHLASVKKTDMAHNIPVLRKDFIFDTYQLYQARAHGADAVLLIVAILTRDQLSELLEASRELWMQCLVEVHDESELSIALDVGAEIIGINNRDLHAFTTDIRVTNRLAGLVPRGKILVSESGINSVADVRGLKKLGVHAVLVGEALVTASDVGAKVRELVGNVPTVSG